MKITVAVLSLLLSATALPSGTPDATESQLSVGASAAVKEAGIPEQQADEPEAEPEAVPESGPAATVAALVKQAPKAEAKSDDGLIGLAVMLHNSWDEVVTSTLAHYLHMLPENWGIIFMHDTKPGQIVLEGVLETANATGRLKLIQSPWTINRVQYNKILQKIEFWELLPAPVVLVFETDTRLCSEPTFTLEFFVKYIQNHDILYIGAPWPSSAAWCESGVSCCCNSGLSLWNQRLTVSTMRHAKPLFEINGMQNLAVDSAMHSIMAMVGGNTKISDANMPCSKVASLFSVESVYTGNYIPLGVHKPWFRNWYGSMDAGWAQWEAAENNSTFMKANKAWDTLISGCPSVAELGPYALSIATKEQDEKAEQGWASDEYLYNTWQAQAFVKWITDKTPMPEFSEDLTDAGCDGVPDINPKWMMHSRATAATAASATAASATAASATAASSAASSAANMNVV